MTNTLNKNTIAESSYQTKSLPLQIIENFQYKQSRGTIIANIPTAKQEGSSNLDQVAYDDSSDAVHNTSNLNAEGNAKQEIVESSRERESGPPNLKASNLPTTNMPRLVIQSLRLAVKYLMVMQSRTDHPILPSPMCSHQMRLVMK